MSFISVEVRPYQARQQCSMPIGGESRIGEDPIETHSRDHGLNGRVLSRISGFEFQANIRNNNREGKPNKPEGEFTHVNNQNLSPYGKRRPN